MSASVTDRATVLRLRYVDQYGRELRVPAPTRFAVYQPLTLASGDPSVIPFKEHVRTIIIWGKDER